MEIVKVKNGFPAPWIRRLSSTTARWKAKLFVRVHATVAWPCDPNILQRPMPKCAGSTVIFVGFGAEYRWVVFERKDG